MSGYVHSLDISIKLKIKCKFFFLIIEKYLSLTFENRQDPEVYQYPDFILPKVQFHYIYHDFSK